jgi:hypothetical protein
MTTPKKTVQFHLCGQIRTSTEKLVPEQELSDNIKLGIKRGLRKMAFHQQHLLDELTISLCEVSNKVFVNMPLALAKTIEHRSRITESIDSDIVARALEKGVRKLSVELRTQ